MISPLRRALAILNLRASKKWPFITRRFPYRSVARMRRAIGPSLSASASLTMTETALPDGDLYNIFKSTTGVHKWLHYLPIYEATLGPLRCRPIRMLEIGVSCGGSLEMWRRYLHPGSVVVGIDIDPSCSRFDDPSRNIHVRIGAQQDLTFLRDITNELGLFDVILDDGSHVASHMAESFRFLFLVSLAPGGIYMAEDLHANYWTDYRDSKMSFVDLVKWLIDAMHAHYLQISSARELEVDAENGRTDVAVPVATLLLEKLEVYDSMVVIHRARQHKELPRSVRR